MQGWNSANSWKWLIRGKTIRISSCWCTILWKQEAPSSCFCGRDGRSASQIRHPSASRVHYCNWVNGITAIIMCQPEPKQRQEDLQKIFFRFVWDKSKFFQHWRSNLHWPTFSDHSTLVFDHSGHAIGGNWNSRWGRGTLKEETSQGEK